MMCVFGIWNAYRVLFTVVGCEIELGNRKSTFVLNETFNEGPPYEYATEIVSRINKLSNSSFVHSSCFYIIAKLVFLSPSLLKSPLSI